jgi:hypothetical protein
MVKNSWKNRIRDRLSQTHKVICKTPAASIVLYGERLSPSSMRSGIRQRCLFSPLPFNIVLEILQGAKKVRRGN